MRIAGLLLWVVWEQAAQALFRMQWIVAGLGDLSCTWSCRRSFVGILWWSERIFLADRRCGTSKISCPRDRTSYKSFRTCSGGLPFASMAAQANCKVCIQTNFSSIKSIAAEGT